MTKSLRERFVEGLTQEGEHKVKETHRYVVYSRKQGGFYYLGRNGALRFGPSRSTSIPASDVRKALLLGTHPRVLSELGLGKCLELLDMSEQACGKVASKT